MDVLEKLNEALRYIEENLAGEIDYREAARRAACSEYHFRRMFSFLAGVPLSEYIRRRRLTLAAFELGDAGILEIALKYGYTSADAFTRAFHGLHGMNPSEARNNERFLTSYPRRTFSLSITGGSEMNYRIVSKGRFRIGGIMKRVPIVFHGVNPEIASMWERLDERAIELLKSLSDIEPAGIIQASTNFSEGRMEEKGHLDHWIGAATRPSRWSCCSYIIGSSSGPGGRWSCCRPDARERRILRRR